ncbi:hypothetical protein PHYSODRAFT_323974 [Phytophthora sojae]|uniref:Crinkler effector protein N-terminal domain-containing protein n=1 Tax=Phytophthora sojae (strain P6497) TaxID=1094619 RepID=G4YQZ7_PHYSP|nr:hypothetical protein PHYSODRAFT_323974 [Phytophthora sojae]EGZ30625.1 hypothetical protein PHYSODRAFT_323974 [Phytophthora sojae]|eukprot:XP_009517900.1 hypothetical protein PHYSODRAFT_323974 [Phytophthora sojae]
MMNLLCFIPDGGDGVLSVEVEEDDSVYGLKSVICKKTVYELPALNLQLFLARKENGSWLRLVDAVAVQLDEDGHPQGFTEMNLDKWLNNAYHFGTNFQPSEGEVHVLVVLPKNPMTWATTAQSLTNQQMKMIVEEVLRERDNEKRPTFSTSSCSRSEEEKLMAKLGFKYSTIVAMEDEDTSIDPYLWQENVAEDHPDQRAACMQYLKDNLRGVVAQDEGQKAARSWGQKPDFYLKDTSQMTGLLDCDMSPFVLKGTASMMIIDDVADQIRLLTNLDDYWYFLWPTSDREIAGILLTSPANGFKMMKDVLKYSKIRVDI